jgi:hypothetical protein
MKYTLKQGKVFHPVAAIAKELLRQEKGYDEQESPKSSFDF